MFKREQQPKSVNFLDAIYSPDDIFADAYIWLVQIGKYLFLLVQLIVLAVFISRFFVDRKNNDLTEEVNNKVVLLSNESWKKNAILFDNYQILLGDIGGVRGKQDINSTKISELTSGVPPLLLLESFSFNEGRVSFYLKTLNLDAVKNYESTLKNNPDYHDVRFNINKEDSDISVRVTFNLFPTEDKK
jgi:hypothetical protein